MKMNGEEFDEEKERFRLVKKTCCCCCCYVPFFSLSWSWCENIEYGLRSFESYEKVGLVGLVNVRCGVVLLV